MEDKLEQLLNSLIEKGWKPFGHEYVSVEHLEELVRFSYEDKKSCIETLRTMTSKESGLWQFVCENKLWKDIDEEKYWHKKTPKMSELRSYDYHFEEYRLIESALKDESELEEFLLDNIKV